MFSILCPKGVRAVLIPLILWLLLPGNPLAAQSNGSETKPPNCPGVGSAQAQASCNKPDEGYSLKGLPRDVLRDQKFLWSRPFRPRRSDLPWAAAFFGTTAGLIAFDRRAGQSISAHPPGSGYQFGKNASFLGTPYAGAIISGSLYLAGWKQQDEYLKTTSLLTVRAAVDSTIIVQVLKAATQRPRPTFSGGVTRDHNADGQFFAGGNSFPSGHTIGAFSFATVIAERYRDRPWVPVTAYSLAALVGAARIAERQHFPSDVFVGAVLGYLVGRHVAHSAGRNPRSAWNHLQVAPYASPPDGSAVTLAWNF
jgi:membrane-associated phospholipid phosphatase